MATIRYYDKELTIYNNGKEISVQRLDINSLYNYIGCKVKVITDNEEIIGYLYDIIYDELNILKSRINKENTYCKIKFNLIKDVVCITSDTYKYKKTKDLDFNFDENYSDPILKRIQDESIIRYEKLPYKSIHLGSNVDGYSKGILSQVYLCSCNKIAIENMIKLYERYFQYDKQVKDRNDLLLEYLGLPNDCNRNIRKEKDNWSSKWIERIKFKDNLCSICNNVEIPHAPSFNIYSSEKKEKYKKETRRIYLENGIYPTLRSDDLPYCIESLMPKEYKKILCPTDSKLKEELLGDYHMDKLSVEKNLLEINKLSKNLKHDFLFDNVYYNSLENINIIKSLNVDDEFRENIYKLMLSRYRKIKKLINIEINKLDKKRNVEMRKQINLY